MLIGGFILAGSREFAFSRSISWLWERREPMLEPIQRGIALLKASPPLEYVPGVRHQVALAVYDRSTGEMFEERIWVSPDGQLLAIGRLPVLIRWWNNFNSVYEIEGRPELTVVANKFLVERKYLPEQQTLSLAYDAPRNRYVDMVYVPYSQRIHTEDVVEAGRAYLAAKVQRAYEELRESQVISRADPDRLVVQVVPRDLVQTIALVEHVDPGWLKVSDDGGRELVERALVIIGANQEWAYRYTNSRAGAKGLTQFIEPTYDLMMKRYPAANLIRDHALGMADHTNAFKAVILFFDAHLAELQNKIEQPDVLANSISREMLVATYNGGPSRVIAAANRYGLAWAQQGSFPDETLDYIKKYQLIKQLEIF